MSIEEQERYASFPREELDVVFANLKKVRERYQKQSQDIGNFGDTLRKKRNIWMQRSTSKLEPEGIRDDYRTMGNIVEKMVNIFNEELSPLLKKMRFKSRQRQKTNRKKASECLRLRIEKEQEVSIPEELIAPHEGLTLTQQEMELIRKHDKQQEERQQQKEKKKRRKKMDTCEEVRVRRPRTSVAPPFGETDMSLFSISEKDPKDRTKEENIFVEHAAASVPMKEVHDSAEIRLKYAENMLRVGRKAATEKLTPMELDILCEEQELAEEEESLELEKALDEGDASDFYVSI